RLLPDVPGAASPLLQFARELFECPAVLAIGIDLQQLEMNFIPPWRVRQRFLQQFFRLGIATVGKENLRLRDRVYFLRNAGGARVGRPQVGISAAVSRLL